MNLARHLADMQLALRLGCSLKEAQARNAARRHDLAERAHQQARTAGQAGQPAPAPPQPETRYWWQEERL